MKNIIVLVLILIVNAVLFSQKEGDNLKDYAGHASYKYDKYAQGYDYAQKYSKQEEAAVKSKLETVNTYFQKNKLVTEPKGVEVLLSSIISENAPLSNWCNSIKYELSVVLYPWFIKNGKPSCKCVECSAGFTLHFNRPDLVFNGYSITGGDDILDENGIVISSEPKMIGEQNGCKIYENGIIVIAAEKPVWIPVSVKEYDNALIRKQEKIKKQNPGDAFSNDFLINAVKNEMGSYTPDELNSPAFVGDKMGGCFYKLEGDQARPIVKLNPDYFDKSKPRTAVQLIIIQSPAIGLNNNGECYLTNEYSSYQSLKLIELLRSINFNELKQYFD